MFKEGMIMKCLDRLDDDPLFVMITADPSATYTQFSGVVLFDKSKHYYAGYVSNSWNTFVFKDSNWEEVKRFV